MALFMTWGGVDKNVVIEKYGCYFCFEKLGNNVARLTILCPSIKIEAHIFDIDIPEGFVPYKYMQISDTDLSFNLRAAYKDIEVTNKSGELMDKLINKTYTLVYKTK